MTRVLIVTSHPVSAPWDSADKQIASVVIVQLPQHRHIYFRRAGARTDLPARGIPVVSRRGKPGGIERAQAALLSVLLQPTVDIVHVVMSPGPGFAQLARLWRLVPSRLRRPLVYTIPGILPDARFALREADAHVVALSEPGADVLRGLGARNVRVIPPGLDLDRWGVVAGRGEGILVAAHLERASALEETVEAVARVRIDGRPPRLVLALRHRARAAGGEAAALRRRAQLAGLDVEIVEEVRDMRPLIRGAAAVVYAPLDLAGKADIPLTLLEAMASGRPVITSDLPQLDALGPSVVRVPRGDVTALAAAIQSLEDDAAWSSRVSSARALVERRFSAAAAGRAYAELYSEIV